MHLTMSRPTPYTVSPSLHLLQRQAAAGYGVAFTTDPCNTEAYTPHTQPYSTYQQQQASNNYASCSYASPLYNGNSPSATDENTYVAAGSTVLCNPPSPSDTPTAFSPSSSSNGATSPSLTQSPQLNGDCSGIQSPLKSYCQYSSPAAGMHQMGCNSFFPHSSSSTSTSDHSMVSTPINGYAHSSYGLIPQSTSSVYPPAAAGLQPDYHSQYSSPLGYSSNPSFSSMALWNYQPVGQYPKVSYDTPRYKLTPERALPLIKWFEDHKDHAYPSRCEKMLLCQSTLLTFTQVSTWFANARRRMKKATQEEDDDEEDSSAESCSSDKDDTVH